ncbi:hypothetical protein OSB04_023882 [Centaurea solstitialis]|uniref:Integrase catalytic domain-containing protein n=1 Tax=Centaurea solstitialis TaxID=347529 RepID=A0AA38W9U7_9ASTR|nr:hypothetical protein OSB04_023882 [Centaurea solstitialis]
MASPSSSHDNHLPMQTILHLITIRLSSSNYLLWKNQMTPLLSLQGLSEHVDGSSPIPTTEIIVDGKNVPNPALPVWIEKDQRAIILLQALLTEEAFSEVVGLSTSRAIWLALESAYGNSSMERVQNLRDRLRHLSKGNDTVSDFGRKFKNICDQLSAISHPVADTDITHWFLCGLGPTFETFSTAIRASHMPQVYLDLLAQAEGHEMFLQAIHGSSTPAVAFSAQQHKFFAQPPQLAAPQQPSVRSSNLGQQPYLAQRGFNGGYRRRSGRGFRGGRGRGRGRRPPHCQLCRTDGHYANTCPQLMSFARNPRPNHMVSSRASVSHIEPSTGDSSVEFGNGLTLPPSPINFDRLMKEALAQGTCNQGLYVLSNTPQLAKSSRLPFELNVKRASHVLDIVHCDLWCPSPVVSVDAYRYYVVFVDEHSRFTWLYPLKTKADFLASLRSLYDLLKHSFQPKLNFFQSDGGTEFLNHKVKSLFNDNDTFHQMSCPYTPQQNGRVERKHRHIVETGLAMMFNARVPATFWVHAFSSAVYIINRLPTKVLSSKSPFEVLFGRIPQYANFKPFGCRVYPFLRNYATHKLAPRSIPCIFVGYNPQYKGYQCLDLDSSRTYVTPHARFNERYFPFTNMPNISLMFVVMVSSALLASCDPTHHSKALFDTKWLNAMHLEMDALSLNNTWTLVPRPKDANVVGSKWLFRTKFRADGSIERHKARLVAQGFSQIPGIDFSYTFSPVGKASTIRVVLSLAVVNTWTLHQLDVNNAFLHGKLTDTVFMQQPPGFVDPKFPDHVCRLNKAIYGLKQAPRAWFHRLHSFLIKDGFTCSRADPSLFVFKQDTCLLYLLVYVDDLILTGNDSNAIRSFITRLHTEFRIKDLGRLNYFLGLEASYTDSGIFLSQVKYANEIIHRAGLSDSTPVATPLSPSISLVRDGVPFDDPTKYRSIVGVLQYLTITRPNIAYAVNQVSQFLHSPMVDHYKVYWARCLDTRRSMFGYSIFMGGNLVSWSAKKQPTVSRSSCESEYRAMANTAAEIIWLTHLLRELHALPHGRPTLLCDNQSALFLTQNPVSHKRDDQRPWKKTKASSKEKRKFTVGESAKTRSVTNKPKRKGKEINQKEEEEETDSSYEEEKSRKAKQTKKDNTKNKKKVIHRKKLPTLLIRTSPKSLYLAMQDLSNEQKEWLISMGFESILTMKIDIIPSTMAYYILLYVNSTTCPTPTVERQVPSITSWNTDLLRRRGTTEIDRGGRWKSCLALERKGKKDDEDKTPDGNNDHQSDKDDEDAGNNHSRKDVDKDGNANGDKMDEDQNREKDRNEDGDKIKMGMQMDKDQDGEKDRNEDVEKKHEDKNMNKDGDKNDDEDVNDKNGSNLCSNAKKEAGGLQDMDASELQDDELFWLSPGFHKSCDKLVERDIVLETTSYKAYRGSMDALIGDLAVPINVIDAWIDVLNDEKYKSQEAPIRLFFNTKDMLFFTMIRGLQYYVIVFNLKTPVVVIIDNDASDEGLPFKYANIPNILKDLMSRYLKALHHPLADLIQNANIEKLDLCWKTTNEDRKNSGVFAMRHLETYKAEAAKKWKSGVYKDCSRQPGQLHNLRMKYTAKILLSDINRK